MDCKQMIEEYLEKNGYDGLVNTDIPCGCSKDEMVPCESIDVLDCEPAYRRKNPNCEACNNSQCDGSDEENPECYTTVKEEV